MPNVQDMIDQIAANRIRDMENGAGYDFLAKQIGLQDEGGTTVDVLSYNHDSYNVELVGVFEDDLSRKREDAGNWIDFMLDSGFSHPRTILKSPNTVSENYFESVTVDGSYYFASNMSEAERKEVYATFADVFSPEPFEENYGSVDGDILNMDDNL